MSCAMVYWGRDFSLFFGIFNRFRAPIDLRPLPGVALGNYTAQPIEHQLGLSV